MKEFHGEIITLRTSHNYDRDQVSNETGLKCDPDEGMAQQQFAEECDINTIVKRFGLTGQLPTNFNPPVSGDFTGINDFHSAMNQVRSAQEEFMKLDGQLRYRFNNDPQRLMEFLEDSNNRDEALKLGLIQKPPEVPRSEPPAEPKP